MRKKSVTGIAALLICLGCASSKTEPQPSPCAQNLLCLLNQEAAASDPVGIHKYSQDLVELILPNHLGQSYINSAADRLAGAEQAARGGRAKLVSEATVAQVFNDLMENTGASDSLRADIPAVERARRAFEKDMPGVVSREKNGANCYPGEAVWVVSMLIANVGRPTAPPAQSDQEPHFGVGAPPAQRYLELFYVRHSRSEVAEVFDHLFRDLQI
jgi:hypothetical protein